VIFRDRVSTQVPLDVTNNREENVRLLSESGGLAVRRALDEGAVRIARRLVGEEWKEDTQKSGKRTPIL
jgi:hypothetical protein